MNYNNWTIGKNKKNALNSVEHRKDFTVIHVNPQELIDKQDPERRVNHSDEHNRIGNRFENAIKHFQSGAHMDPPVVGYNRYSGLKDNYPIDVADGRHRIAAAAHLGLKSIPVHIMKKDKKDLKQNLQQLEENYEMKSLTELLKENLDEAYANKHGHIQPEFDDVEDDIRDGTYNPRDYKPGGKHFKNFQQQNRGSKITPRKYRDVPREESGVEHNPNNKWHQNVMEKRKNGVSIDAHENRVFINGSGKNTDRIIREVQHPDNQVVDRKHLKLQHANPGETTEVHVFKSGLRIPVKDGHYMLQHSYALRNPKETKITPPIKK